MFGDPIECGEKTAIPVSRIGSTGSEAFGVFVIGPEHSEWLPTVDADRIALIGVATGFVAATLACLAIIKQPPWPSSTAMVEFARHRRAR